ncbi:TetR/AcrR family transcriptional regulator [Yinghuangia sp. YIM S09857]|uniref:TetR/AcrR family transcriptional regulator n=1 Tax=Yinghuangia sp. YIM S09857 TaxID=3436929 RepID=UPI003F538FE3
MSPRRSVADTRGTRARIIARSAAIASVDGLEGLTIGRLATDLGMSKAGVLGHFGTKEALQIAALDGASEEFVRLVWEPAADRPAGIERLVAVCEAWTAYLVGPRAWFPGGCLFTTASIEFDAREGPVRDKVLRLFTGWRKSLTADVLAAIEAKELPLDTDPDQIVFELFGIYLALNQAVQLFRDPLAAERARTAVHRLLPSGEAAAAG